MGFQNKEERLIQRAYNDFFYLLYDAKNIEDKYLFQRGFCKALTLLIFNAESLPIEDDFKQLIDKYFPQNTDEFLIEEVEIKFKDDDLLLLQLHYIQKFSSETISLRMDLSKEDVSSKIDRLKNLWGNNQDMSLTDYLLQIEKRQWYKRLSNNPIPLQTSHSKKRIDKITVGEINKIELSFWDKIKNFFS